MTSSPSEPKGSSEAHGYSPRRREAHEENAKRDVIFDTLSNRVIGCAIEVHRQLGPGLLESTYEQCLAYELNRSQIPFQFQIALPVQYKQMRLECGYRIDC